MVRGSTNEHQWSRENLQAKSKKGYNVIKKKEKKTESAISNHRKYIWEDSKNRKNKTHKGTHNR